MDNLELAKSLLEKVNMPVKQQSTLCCLTLLAMAKLKNGMFWNEATNDWVRINVVLNDL